jgi:hypothetical protein
VVVRALDVFQRRREQQSPAQARASSPVNCGSRSSARCSFAVSPRQRICVTRRTKPVSRCSRTQQPQEGRLRIRARDHAPALRCARPIRVTTPPPDRLSTSDPRHGLPVRSSAPAAVPRPWPAHRTARPCRPRLRAALGRPPRTAAASRYSSVSTVPGERGPKFVPSTASKPSAPFSSGVLEILLEQVMHVHAADAQQLAHVARPSLRICQPSRSSASVAQSVGAQPRRRLISKHRLQRLRQARSARRRPWHRRGVRPPSAPAAADSAQRCRAAATARSSAWPRGPKRRPCDSEIQVAQQRAGIRCSKMRAGRDAETRARTRASPRRRRPGRRLEHQHRAAARAR